MTVTHDTTDRLLTEVERQAKYLAKLPDDFSFPLFNAAQALESQRRSGYRNTAAAAREIIDKPRVPERLVAKVRNGLEAEAKQKAKVEQTSIEAARKALEEVARRRPYVVDFYDEPRDPFYRPLRLNGSQIVVQINRQHSFFQTLYSPLLTLPGGAQSKQALDVLLIALARSELAVENEETATWYLTQRERAWSEFLADAYRSLQQRMAPIDEESAEAEDSRANDDKEDVADLQAAE